MSSENIYYVYIYKHPVTKTPFYVGYGKGKRYLVHLNEASRNPTPIPNEHKLNTIRKLLLEGLSPIIEIIDENISKIQACELEIFLISEIGRRDLKNGPLTNKTSGGDGNRDWSDDQKYQFSLMKKELICVLDPINGDTFTVHKHDPRWLSGELVGVNKGKTGLNKNGNQSNYIQAKNPITGQIFRIKSTDPRWLSGELVGINKGKPAHQNAINAAKARKGIPNTKEHNKKVGESIKLLKWYCNFELNKVGRFKENEQPNGYIRVCGPHKLLTIEQYNEEKLKQNLVRKLKRQENSENRRKNNSLAQYKFRKENPFFGLSDEQIKFVVHILTIYSSKPDVPMKNSIGKYLTYIRAFSIYYSNLHKVSLHTILSIVNGKKPNLINGIKNNYPKLTDICEEILSAN